jgi:hypothetical protein
MVFLESASYNMSWGSMPWLLVGEMFSGINREVGAAIGTITVVVQLYAGEDYAVLPSLHGTVWNILDVRMFQFSISGLCVLCDQGGEFELPAPDLDLIDKTTDCWKNSRGN